MDTTQIILIVFIVVLLVAYPILMFSRNKKENQRMQEQTNSLKRGDKVLTTSGVYGTIVDLHLEENKKIVTIETGTEKNKGYISVDAYAIYTIFKEEETTEATEQVDSFNENPTEEQSKETVEEVKEQSPVVEEPVQEEIKQETLTIDQETESKTSKKRKKK